MDIGEEKEKYVIEPLEDPVAPAEDPVPSEEPDRELVPADNLLNQGARRE